MMSDIDLINVPEFESMQDFADWVGNLTDKQIQSWRAKDWVFMFKKLSSFVERSPEIASKIPQYLSSIGQTKAIEELSSDYLSRCKSEIFRKEPIGIYAMAKLYMNYRMEPRHIKQLYKLAKEAGEKAIAIKDIPSAQLGSLDKSSLKCIACELDKIVYEQTWYSSHLENREMLRAKIDIVDNLIDCGTATAGVSVPHVVIRVLKGSDACLSTIFHELAHAHLQTPKYRSKIGILRRHKPVTSIDTDLCQLMTYNNRFYLNFDNLVTANNICRQEINAGKFGKYRAAVTAVFKQKSRIKSACCYEGQPSEYFAHLYGYTAAISYARMKEENEEKSMALFEEFCTNHCR